MSATLAQAPAWPAGLRAWLARPAEFGLTRGELLLYALILSLAAALRIWDLGSRTLHHDEAIHAKLTFDFVQGQQYRYDPAYHGPFLFFTTGALFAVFGASEVLARVLPALFGVAVVAVVGLFRPELGRVGTPLAMFALTISTGFLYYSRFARNDIYVAFFTLVIVAAVVRYLARPRPRWIYIAWTALALSFVTKENTYIHGFQLAVLLGLFGAVALVVRLRPAAARGRLAGTIARAVGRFGAHADSVIYGLLIFFVVAFVFYTAFLTHLPGFRDAFTKSVSYWTDVHESERVNQPWFYYLMFLALYEPFALFVGGFALLRLRTATATLPLVLSVWTVSGFAVYSVAGEKAPWLALHVTWPLVLLASWYVGRRLVAPTPFIRRISLALVAGGLLAWTLWFAIPATFSRGEIPNDFVVYVQSAPDVQEVAAIIREAGRRYGDGLDLPVVIENTYAWPFAWYLREHTQVLFVDDVRLEDAQRAPIVLLAPATADQLGISLPDHVGRTFKLRWWFPEFAYKDWGPGIVGEFLADPVARETFWNWLIEREQPPVELGSFDFVLYVRTDLLAVGPLGPYKL